MLVFEQPGGGPEEVSASRVAQVLAAALEWMVRRVALFSEFPHPMMGPAPQHLARLTGQLGTGALEQAWQQVTGGPLPPAVRGYVESS